MINFDPDPDELRKKLKEDFNFEKVTRELLERKRTPPPEEDE